jgi:hypothetical protein
MKLNRLKQIIKEEILREIKVERSPDIVKPPFFTLENHGHYVFNAGADAITNPWFSELRKDNRIHDWYEYDANTPLEPNKDLNYYLDAMPSIPRKVYKTLFATLDAYKIPFEWWFEPKFVDDEGEEYSPMLKTTLDLRKIPSEYIELRNLREIKVEAPKPLKLIRVPNGYELAIGPYITNYRLRRMPPPGYEIIPGFVDAYIGKENDREFLFTVVEPLKELERQSVDKVRQIFNKFNVKFEFIEPHYFLIPISQASFQDEINEIKVAPPVPSEWKQIQVDTDQDPKEDIQVELYKTPAIKKGMSQFYDLVYIMKTPDKDAFTGESIKPKYWVELFVYYFHIYDSGIDSGIVYDNLEEAREEAINQMRKITTLKNSSKEIKEIKIEKPSDVRLVFVPMPEMSKNVDPVTGEKGEPKLVLGNEYMIARDNIKIPGGYVHIKVGDDYYNNMGVNEYHIKINKEDELKKVKDLLDKYKVKYFFSDMSNDKPYYSFLISTDQIANAEGWES